MLEIISKDKICFVIAKARQFDVKEAASDPASGSNASDDGMTDVLEDMPDDPTRSEIVAFVRGMNVDERAALIALAWIGRGTYDSSEWKEAMSEARSEHPTRVAEYLLGLPMLADYLNEALAAFGENCESFETGRM